MPANFATLPTELLMMIERELDTMQLARLTMVCRRFRDLWADDVSLFLVANLDDSLAVCIAYYTSPDLAGRHPGISDDRRKRFVRLRIHRLRLAQFRRIISCIRVQAYVNLHEICARSILHANSNGKKLNTPWFSPRSPISCWEGLLAWISKAEASAREDVEKYVKGLGSAETLLDSNYVPRKDRKIIEGI